MNTLDVFLQNPRVRYTPKTFQSSNHNKKDIQPRLSNTRITEGVFTWGFTINNLPEFFQLTKLGTTPEDSQPMISYRLVYHPKHLEPIISEL